MWVNRFSFVADDGDTVGPLVCLKCDGKFVDMDAKPIGGGALYSCLHPIVIREPEAYEITVTCHGKSETSIRRQY